MIETTADARRRGLYNPDFYINETNRHMFPPITDDNLRKECKSFNYPFEFSLFYFVASSSSSLESLSNISSAGVQSLPGKRSSLNETKVFEI
jgi:hypothetical protein